MSKYIIGVITIVVGVLFAYALINGNSPAGVPQIVSAIIVEEPSYDFGDIDIFGGKVSTTYTLRNEGEQDVSITSAVTSCMCTEGEIGGMRFGMHGNTSRTVTIPAGGERILTAIYDPLAHGPNGVGKVTRYLMLETNSLATPEIRVRVDANVVKNENN
jgi:hypothetical protein